MESINGKENGFKIKDTRIILSKNVKKMFILEYVPDYKILARED